jgi:hypothetical protein
MPSAVIVGNCQAQLLEVIMMTHTDWKITRVPPVFTLGKEDEDAIMGVMSSADIIFAQRITDDFPVEYVRSSRISSVFDNVISWPNLYFSGYFPDIEYCYIPNIGKLIGPLDDYHPNLVMNHYKTGKSVEDCVRAYQPEQFEILYPNPIERSLHELETREADTDTSISEYIRDTLGHRKMFFTVNHPINDLLFEMAERLMRAAGYNITLPRKLDYGLSRINIPIYPSVRNLHGLGNLPDSSYVGINRYNIHVQAKDAASRVYVDMLDMFEAFYRFYDSVLTKTERTPA